MATLSCRRQRAATCSLRLASASRTCYRARETLGATLSMKGGKSGSRRRRRIGRPPLLTPALHKKIVALVRKGPYAWVAAQACGVPPATFKEWMARGEERDPDRPSTPAYAAFAADVRKAEAQRRMGAEMRVYQADPKFYLRCGPGRERHEQPGWTDSVQTTGPDGGPVQASLTLTKEEARSALEMLRDYRRRQQTTAEQATVAGQPPSEPARS